ncbi:hypothetical protein [Paenibacillus sp. DMB20]|uniref:hypothetical protein n=1 Tax=Paenibacillus sp. DMB20 TaxID=1642570 RepID=UPI000B2B891E|nr:hypothetical protein [Paenibacillus sp. DMB20]
MLQRPLPFFTVCWVAGTSAACMYSGMQLFLVLTGLALLLTVPMWLGRSRPLFMGIMVLSLLGSAGLLGVERWAQRQPTSGADRRSFA